MATTPEAKVKKAVIEVLRTSDIYYFSPVTGGFGKSGVPDIIACYKGRFIAIECKAGGNTPTALQMREIERIRGAKGVALVVNENNIGAVKDIIDWIDNGR
jgi:Holliday junction resolvase